MDFENIRKSYSNTKKQNISLESFLQQEREKNRYDPRQDIKEDSNIWKQVLKAAEKVDRQIYCNLHGCRCGGARIKIEGGQLKLIPAIGPDQFWKNKNDWNQDRKEFLLPYTKDIKKIFQKVQKEVF